MQNGAQPTAERLVALPQCAIKEILKQGEFQNAQKNSADHQVEPERLQVEGFGAKGSQIGIKCSRGNSSTAWDHGNAESAKFSNLVGHIRLDRRRELIREIGDSRRQLAKATSLVFAWGRFWAASRPATLNNNPFTNW